MSTSVVPPGRASGVAALGHLAWGEHLCQFYRTKHDLEEMLVPFFAAGLRGNERCIWIASSPLPAAEARVALRAEVPDLDEREARGQIEIRDHHEWYLHDGGLCPDEVIAGWLEREAAALRDGYAGLRLTGNTLWLEPHQWTDFAEYETRVHAAFQDRRIIALCSYSLDRCGRDEVLDVMRNHKVALIRNAGQWDALRSATAALAFLHDEPAHAQHAHTLDVFAAGAFPAARIAATLCGALESGAAAWAIALPAHLEALRAELGSAGIDLEHVLASEQLGLFDAEALYAACRDRPREGIAECVLEPMTRALARYGRLQAWGEAVDLFTAAGDHASALAIEQWWNEQLPRHAIQVQCGYRLESFAGVVDRLRTVCHVHEAVVPLDPDAPMPARAQAEVALLSRALASEARIRQELEPVRDHLITLQRVMTQLGEVNTLDELVEVVEREIGQTFGTSRVALLVDEGGEWHDLVSRARAPFIPPEGVRPVQLRNAEAIHRDAPALAALSPHAVALLPLRVRRQIGVLGLGFPAPQEFDTAWRALATDLAHSIAQALDRARAYDAAERASRAKDEFLAMLGHELRNPLSPILTAVQLMRARGEDRFARERAVIERQASNLVRLLDDLLDVSRIARGKINLQRRHVTLATVITQAVEQTRGALLDKAHRLEVDVEPGVAIDADPERLAQVFANLLGNAAKYTPPGGTIAISTELLPGRVRIAVRDTGEGIEPTLLAHVFDVFVQGKQERDRAQGGLGLGLAVAQNLVALHGGTIRAASEGPGRGSVFTVELDRVPEEATPPASEPRVRPARTVATRRLLVVDDNEDAASLLALMLEEVGHAVRVAADPHAALAIAREYRPDVAVLDIGLPGMDGYELAAALRAQQADTPPSVIALSGYGQPSDLARSQVAGFSDHLVKPVDFGKLLDVIATATRAS